MQPATEGTYTNAYCIHAQAYQSSHAFPIRRGKHVGLGKALLLYLNQASQERQRDISPFPHSPPLYPHNKTYKRRPPAKYVCVAVAVALAVALALPCAGSLRIV